MKRIAAPAPIDTQLAALGDMTRLRILRLLEREELSVGEVAKVLQMPQSTVSRHIKVLCDAMSVAPAEGAWLAKRTEGTATFYRMILDDLPERGRALWVSVRDQLAAGSEIIEDNRRLAGVLLERRGDSQSFFGRVAGQWDDLRTDLFGDRFTPLALLTLLMQDAVVADLGCGTGNASECLAPFVKRVIAVDQSAPMLRAAKKRLARFENVEFLRAPVESLPIDDASVDAAVLILVLHHIDDPGAACREVARILRPGGSLLVVDMVEHDRTTYRHTMGHKWLGFSKQAMQERLGAAGLCAVRYLELPTDAGAKGPGLFACTAQAPAVRGSPG